MPPWFSDVVAAVPAGLGFRVLSALFVAVVGLALATIARRIFLRLARRLLPEERAQFLARALWILVAGAGVAAGLEHLGFDLSVLLGAAGVLTVAVGFASQTSASNIISGLFLVTERPFGVGDTIKLGQTVGEVVSIDLLSIKLRTFDNLAVRIPNESAMKSEIINMTRYEIRRLELPLSVDYRTDLDHVRAVVLSALQGIPSVLDEPEAAVRFAGFGASGLDLVVYLWCDRTLFLPTRDAVGEAVLRALGAAKIQIPFPHQVLVAESGGAPLRVELSGPVAADGQAQGATGGDT